MSHQDINKFIKDNNLAPTSQRDLVLLSLSCMSLAYTRNLKDVFGYDFAHDGLLAIGEDNHFSAMLNERLIRNKVGNYLKETKDYNLEILERQKRIYERCLKKFIVAEREKDGFKKLSSIIQFYRDYMTVIGFYNCFWRYVGNDHKKFADIIIKKISSERDLVAKLYPKVNSIIIKECRIISRKYGFRKNILPCLSWGEMKLFLKNKVLTPNKVKELYNRNDKYLYLCDSKKEVIISDKEIIDKINFDYFKINKEINKIKGYSAYGGKVAGKVFNATESKESKKIKGNGNKIFVTSATHPGDIMLIKKSVGIVTDEGGILSHAAIIARELRKPCIIGTKIATSVLHDGDLVEVDANNGIIKIINKK